MYFFCNNFHFWLFSSVNSISFAVVLCGIQLNVLFVAVVHDHDFYLLVVIINTSVV